MREELLEIEGRRERATKWVKMLKLKVLLKSQAL
jgi:hypothetical protein